MRALHAWFGERAIEERPGQTSGIDLDAFARKHEPRDTLLLFDLMCTVAAAEAGIDPRQIRQLEFAARRLWIDPVVAAAVIRRKDPSYERGREFPLTGDRIVIGSSPACDIVLPDPQVLPRHAELLRLREGWRIVDLGRTRPILVNGEPVTSSRVNEQSIIRIGPAEIRIRGDSLVVESQRGFSTLSVRRVSRTIAGFTALDDLSFTAVAGEIIAIVGPSGGGKTTLVTAIQGTALADRGEVTLDGEPFHALLQKSPTLAGDVPQDDLVLPELTVEETLHAASCLRYQVSDAVRQESVLRVLKELDIGHIRNSRIGDVLRRGVSGGQRKRVNLGQELLGDDTRVLFLDEPTSGLDPQASQDIVHLVRRLADKGRIVMLVTHDLSPEVVGQVDHLLVLARGGRMAWFGPPNEACAWFGVATPDALFHRLRDRSPQEWAEAYSGSDAARTWLHTREAALQLGLLGASAPVDAPRAGRPTVGRQLRTLIGRYSTSKWRDRTGLLVLAAQPPVLAAGLGIVYPGVASGTVFVLTLSCMWFGMFASVRELIADRVMWRRERRLGVSVLAYLGSKVAVLGTITALQCLLMVGLCWTLINFAANGYSFGSLFAVCTLTGWAGMGLALVVGALWTSSEAAVGSLPILLVPQLLFSSILVSLRHMDPLSTKLSWLTIQRYSLDAALKTGTQFEQPSKFTTEWERRDLTGALYQLGLKPAEAENMGVPWWVLLAALGGWALGLVSLAGVLIWARDRPPSR